MFPSVCRKVRLLPTETTKQVLSFMLLTVSAKIKRPHCPVFVDRGFIRLQEAAPMFDAKVSAPSPAPLSYTSADVPETAPWETSSHEHHGQHVPTSVIRG